LQKIKPDMMRKFLLLIGCLFYWMADAQVTFPENDVADERDGTYAFTNANLHINYNTKVSNGTLVIKDGKVVAAGTGVRIPPEAVVIDLEGKSVYPAFIDLYADYGLPEVKQEAREWRRPPQFTTDKEGPYAWNEALRAEFDAVSVFQPNKKDAKTWQEAGIGSVLSHRQDGISRGSATLVLTGEGRAHTNIVREKAGHFLSFSKGSSSQNYPSSLMGYIALIRQTYLDGQWYATTGKEEEKNLSLEAWNQLQDLPQFFAINEKLDIFRIDQIGKEFGVQYIAKGTGEEYQRAAEIKRTGMALILPLNFPDAYDVEKPFDADMVSLADMKHWEMAPANPAILEQAGVEFAFTTEGLKKKTMLMDQVRKAVSYGLSKEKALKALTYTPASLCGAEKQVGLLQPDAYANFIISDKDLFEKDAAMLEIWVKGVPTSLKPLSVDDISGKYTLQIDGKTFDFRISGKENEEMKIEINDSTSIKVKGAYNNSLKTISLSFSPAEEDGKYRLQGTRSGKDFTGKGQSPNGNWFSWSANYLAEEEKKEKEEEGKEEEPPQWGDIVYPFGPYGRKELPKAGTVLFKNATVWTNEEEGILSNADVLIKDGKISKVGQKLSAPAGAQVVDAEGMHLTSGVIDEHTHIGISRGVNEGTQASSAEVRIGDVIDSEDINIYRQLSGGVVAAQQLHGSANPIGGQSALIKFRWGMLPEDMKIKGADGFIKFALGENVKQSNWGDHNDVRFPQTRMGVEQVYMDYFTRAQEYEKKKLSGKPFRKDLDLEAVLEIINKERFITCHSYRQSEINMLMKVAEHFGFTVNTFTHILEGYKIADIMAEHGAGGSTFSDWWAYKFEVWEAIPYNGALMHEQGVVVAFNSDDAEMARRLNQEAAKAVKYGGVSEEDAWKFVTLNPAKLLHLDDRMGSIKTGKDADLVLWSDNPLSIEAKAMQTWVDGRKYFDREEDKAMREAIAAERNRLIQKMLEDKKKGGKTQSPKGRKKEHYHCDTIEEW
jgi:imidazolonepropionase-like amidohydrolase